MNVGDSRKEVKVLVVDNGINTLEELRVPLNQFLPNWHLSAIDSGKQCMNIINTEGKPDLLIMGMNLSDIPALDLLKQIRDDSDIPVVIISDSTDIQKLVEAFDDGANDYILKPFNQRIFTTRLKTLLIRERKLNRVKR